MPIAAVAGVAGIAGSVVNVGNQLFGGGGGGGGGTTGIGSTGGGGIQSNEQGFYGSNASNPFYGVNISSKPMDGEKPPSTPTMHASEAGKPRVSSANQTPTQPKYGYNTDYWADRLQRYLDYNTRSLG